MAIVMIIKLITSNINNKLNKNTIIAKSFEKSPLEDILKYKSINAKKNYSSINNIITKKLIITLPMYHHYLQNNLKYIFVKDKLN